MRIKQLYLFFDTLDRELNTAAEVILTGASAGTLMGHIRPSLDIDFEIRLRSTKSKVLRRKLSSAIKKASAKTGLAVNYSEDIRGWSMINYLDYRKTAISYKSFGKLRVKLIEPAYWTIGKMARFLELDIQDVLKIVRSKKIPATRLIRLWARAANESDLSLELGQFCEHVVYFLQKYSRRAWGRETDPKKLIQKFERLVKA